MSLDLAQFHEAFFEESFEALESMEAALLKLDVGAPDPEIINTVFRVAHSIKGGAGMFNFADIGSFTHTLESLLDGLRGGGIEITPTVLNLLLRSVDVLREMLRAAQRHASFDAQRVADLQLELEVVAATQGAPAVRPAPAAWCIEIRPLENLLMRGNDPLALFGALTEYGELHVEARAEELPPLAELDPNRCYLSWRVRLQSDCPQASIDDVFEWVEGDCEYRATRESAMPAGRTPSPASVAPEAPAAAVTPAETVVSTPAAPKSEPTSAGGDTGSIRVAVHKIDELINTVGEIVITQSMLAELGSQAEGPSAERLRSGLAQLERNVRELHESVMRVRMLPIGFAFSRFPRLVRDVAQRLGKQIELKLTGEQTELDKTVLERIGDPLVHLVRNSIDHGIEMPEERAAAGKPRAGTVHLGAVHRGSAIIIEVSDDGQGLNGERILAKARSRGLVGPGDTLTEAEIFELIFLPGFSTAEQTTDLSGRGVGMDVVRRNIKSLGGKIEIHSERGRGSRFTISLPLTLAIVDGQSVCVGGETYIVPLVSIVESLQIKPGGASRLSVAGEVFSFRGDYLPLVRLHELFGVEPRKRSIHEGLVVVTEGEGQRVGLFVDDLRGQQQVVIKSLETNYGHVPGISGATILGDGSVALIIDVPGLIRSISRSEAA